MILKRADEIQKWADTANWILLCISPSTSVEIIYGRKTICVCVTDQEVLSNNALCSILQVLLPLDNFRKSI
jgi:hypothetical protein